MSGRARLAKDARVHARAGREKRREHTHGRRRAREPAQCQPRPAAAANAWRLALGARCNICRLGWTAQAVLGEPEQEACNGEIIVEAHLTSLSSTKTPLYLLSWALQLSASERPTTNASCRGECYEVDLLLCTGLGERERWEKGSKHDETRRERHSR